MVPHHKTSLLSGIVYLCFVIYVVHAKHKHLHKDYCNPSLCNGTKHIACEMKEDQYGNDCSIDADVVEMSPDLQAHIVQRLNELRNKVARGGFNGFSKAARMLTIIWDDDLSFIAEFNVRKCKLHRDPCRNTEMYKNVGQTVSYRGLKGKNAELDEIISQQITMWFNEEKMTSMDDISNYIGPHGAPNRNFLQLVTEDTTRVGCAILQQSKNGWVQTFLTCNFDNAPVAGKEIYHSSAHSGDDCKSGKNPNFEYLCNPDNDTKDETVEKRSRHTNNKKSKLHRRTGEHKNAEVDKNELKKVPIEGATVADKNELKMVPIEGAKESEKKEGSEKKPANKSDESSKEEELEMWRGKFKRFQDKLNAALKTSKTRNIVIITMNHEVDIDKKPENNIVDQLIAERTHRIQDAIETRSQPFQNRGISSRTVQASPKIDIRTQRAKHHRSGVAKWRTVRR